MNMQAASPPVSAPASGSRSPKTHLLFLDGIRGLAAFYVVLFHAYGAVHWPRTEEALADYGWATGWLANARFAVIVFIVLSGYCLMLPVARTEGLELRGGFVGFIKRRAWRILPPYYAAMAICLAIIAWVPGMGQKSGNYWDICLPEDWTLPVISHLFLFHNFYPDWSSRIDYPMWSVATEWQIYLCFALVLLPVWRRAGAVMTLLAAGVLGVIPHFISPKTDVGFFHYLFFFAFGMAAAKLPAVSARRVPWGLVALGFTALCQFNLSYPLGLMKTHGWIHYIVTDTFAALACTALIIGAARVQPGQRGIIAVVFRLLNWRPVVALGTFSYSLYLMHAPILAWLYLQVPESWTPIERLLYMLGVGGVASLALTYLFHLVFERPFMSSNSRPQRSVAYAAAVSPAP